MYQKNEKNVGYNFENANNIKIINYRAVSIIIYGPGVFGLHTS